VTENLSPSRIATVGDLIDRLEQIDPETPLRVAFQPAWPLAGYVEAVTEVHSDPETGWTRGVWLAISGGVNHGEHPYAPRAAWTGDG
jgi:hypothetical protein